MKQKHRFALLLALRLLCTAIFVLTAVLSVGARIGRATDGDQLLRAFADASPLTPPTPTEPPSEPATEPEHVEPSEPDEPDEPDPGSAYQIVPVDLSVGDGGDLLFKNETGYTFDTQALLRSGYPIPPVTGDEPAVLILHTHATESYTEEGADVVTDTRSSDPERNVIAVGKALCETLEAHGVPTLHCTVAHDAESFNDAYSRSADSAKEYLAKYPSIKYVIDLHRDAIETAGGGMAKPVTEADGTALAQVMLVVGSNEGGADHPGWKTNLCVAARAQQALLARVPDLARPINLRSASFNQQYSPGYLLLEVGTCANTLSEAQASARIFGEVFAELITG